MLCSMRKGGDAVDYSRYAESRARATKNYRATHERINPFFDKGTIDRIRALGYTPNGFVKEAAMERLEREENEVKRNRSNTVQ